MNFIYHGTTAEAARLALTDGLHPRGESGGNWDDHDGLYASNPGWVYLTKDAPLYYAAVSVNSKNKLDKTAAVLRLDLDRLDTTFLRPDEDYFILRTPLKHTASLEEIKQRAELSRTKAQENPQMWKDSLEAYGSIAYEGIIPAEAILDVKFINFQFYSVLHGAMGTLGEKVADREPVVNLHRQLMAWLYGKNRLQSKCISTVIKLAAENAEVPLQVYLLSCTKKIHNLRDRDGISFQVRPNN